MCLKLQTSEGHPSWRSMESYLEPVWVELGPGKLAGFG